MGPILLALETATNACSVALLMEGRVIISVDLDRPRAHAENLVPMIGDALRYGGIEPSDLDVVAVADGPGSYTGLRIGAGTAKGLAAAVDAHFVAVSSLEALASAGEDFTEPGDRIASAFDARRDEVFAALFAMDSAGGLRTLRSSASVGVEEIVGWLGDGSSGQLRLLGDGWEKLVDRLRANGVSFTWMDPERYRPSAERVARLALLKFNRGETEDLAAFEPYYLKEFVAKNPSMSVFEKLPF